MPNGELAAARYLIEAGAERHPDELAALIEKAEASEATALLDGLPIALVPGVLASLTPDRAARLLGEAAPERAATWVEGSDPNRVAAVIARLEPDAQAALLDHVPSGLATELRALATYAPDTAGSLMDTRVTTFRRDATASDVLAQLTTFRSKRIQDVFVLEPDGRFVGSVSLVNVVLAEPDARLEALPLESPALVQATASRQEVLDTLEARPGGTVAVVDFEGHAVGVLRQAELLETMREATAASVTAMFGAGRDERALAPPWVAVQKRLPWLLINLLTAFLASAVVGVFEGTIAQITALAVLLPVVAGQSGNTGAQALAVTMRSLALREIRTRHWSRVAFKETLAGAANGVAVALATGAGVFAWSQSLPLAAVIAVSMVISMTIAGLAGASIPIVLTSIGRDPAQSSSIILTTVTDVIGFFSFLGIATLLASTLVASL